MSPETKQLLELGERIAVAAANIDAAMHRLLTDLREFDAQCGWYQAHATSAAHWLSWRVGWDLATARDRVRVARKLGELPLIDDALRRGELSYSKCRALVRVARPDNQELLLMYARTTTAAQLEKICRRYQAVLRHAGKADDGEPARRYLTRRVLDDGMVKIEIVLHPDEAELVWGASLAAARRVSAETLCLVDGLVEVVKTATGESGKRTPVEVVVTVPKVALMAGPTEEVGTLSDGTPVSAETARCLSCDAGVVEVTETDDGEVLSVGRKTRTIPSALKRALLRRDRTCRYPGCSNSTWVHGHHLKHWADGGETKLTNLISLCSTHHRMVHERGIRIELDESREAKFYSPDGKLIAGQPPRPWLSADPLADITAANANANVTITADTNRCGWDGTPVQYEWISSTTPWPDRLGP